MKTSTYRVFWAIVACLLINLQNLKANNIFGDTNEMGGFYIIAAIVGGSLVFYFVYGLFSKTPEKRPNKENFLNSARNHQRHHQRHIVKKSS